MLMRAAEMGSEHSCYCFGKISEANLDDSEAVKWYKKMPFCSHS